MSKRRATTIMQGIPTMEGGGVEINRLIGGSELNTLDPFLLFDEFKSDKPAEYEAGFPPHPHRGFETVTYMLAGQVNHEDNQGHRGTVGPGGVQWMTAGKGVVHSEMPESINGLVHGFQLWVNLPSTDKMTEPRYHEYTAAAIPTETRGEGAEVRVIAGTTSAGTRGAVTGITTDPLYLDVRLRSESAFIETIPVSHSVFMFAIEGQLLVVDDNKEAGKVVDKGTLAVLDKGDQVHIEGLSDESHFLLVAGRRINEPVARYGPFVMNTQAELMQAVTDYQSGNF